ncbi:MAG: hypothetical protein ABI533_08025 [Betaproteobacteria bacterium]
MMRHAFAVLSLFLCSMTSAMAEVYVNFDLDLRGYPQLTRVPGYPVYYAPRLDSNYFFYDGLYWVYTDDNWYASTWYNGPWETVGPDYVPLYLLRVPVRYYRHAPAYFRGWGYDAPPRWGEHWGRRWHDRHRDWDRWNHRASPEPAPLPLYQRQYAGNRYPRVEQQSSLHARNYRYAPRDAAAAQHYERRVMSTPLDAGAGRASTARGVTAEHRDARPSGNRPVAAPGAMEQRRAAPRAPSPQQAPVERSYERRQAQMPRRAPEAGAAPAMRGPALQAAPQPRRAARGPDAGPPPGAQPAAPARDNGAAPQRHGGRAEPARPNP